MMKKDFLYKTISNQIKTWIEQGRFESTNQLPTTTELAKEFATSPMTINKALELLVNNGFITRLAGKGTFVKKRSQIQTLEPKIKHGIIGAIVYDTSHHDLWSRALRGIEDALQINGYNLIIEKGVNIGIGLNKSILVYGELHVKGTEVEPIIISNTDHNSFFGSVASIGNGETESVIEYLHIWGGSNANINGIHSSGALSLYNHNSVKILNSRIFNNSGDDGINVKNSIVLLDGNILDGNAADQLDIDASSGLVKNNQFFSKPLQNGYKLNQISIDDNGDGADFSGSNIRVKNNKFYGFLDKAISIGENTKAIVTGNNLFNNNSAIVAKDQSKVFIYKNIYKNNSIDVQMYRKKPFFNFPEVYDFNNNQGQVKNIKKTLGSKYYKLSNMNKKLDFNIESMNFLDVENIDWLEVGY